MTTPKSTTAEDAGGASAEESRDKYKLFLETSAQFHRLTGPRSIRDTINQLIRDADSVSTSWYVEREFEYVYGGFLDSVMGEVRKLPNLSRPREFWEMWLDVDYQMRLHYLGGPKFFWSLGVALHKEFSMKPVSPTRLINELGGRREHLLKNFYKGTDFFNKSSCGVWDKPCSCKCGPEPGDACRLKEIGVAMRDKFLAAAVALGGANCSESKWLRDNYDFLEAAHGKALLELLGRHRDHVSDIVIFWEVPDGWTILTRDRAFRKMQKKLRNNALKVYDLRLPRHPSDRECVVRLESAPEEGGVLINHNAKGARIRATPVFVKRLKVRQLVTVSASEFGSRESPELGNSRQGRVVYRDDLDESVFAVRFPSK
jgi:hypothetical protein